MTTTPPRSLRFCMVTTFYPPHNFGGDGNAVRRLAHELADRSHQVDVAYSADAYRLMTGRDPAPLPPHPGVRVIPLRSAAGLLAPTLAQQTGRPVFNRQLRRLLENGNYDVIHFNNMSLIGLTALRFGDAVKLYTTHDHWLVCPMHVLWRLDREPCARRTCLRCVAAARKPPQYWRGTGLVNRCAAEVDAFIAPSQFTLEKHAELGLRTRRSVVIPHFASAPPANAAMPVGDPYFLFVGRLEKIKGAQVLVRVFREMPHRRLVIAGEGAYRAELERLAGDAPNIVFVGSKDELELAGLYRGALATLVPSLCFEVFGLVLIESLAAGTPVIAHDLGSLPEIVAASGAGLLYRTDGELAQAVEKLASDADLRRRFSLSATEAFQAHWTADRYLGAYLGLIDDLMAGRETKKPATAR